METVASNKTRTFPVPEIVADQRAYFQTGATLNVEFRIAQLKKLKSAIEQYEHQILEALKQDLNRDHTSGYLLEVGFILNELDETLRHIRKWTKPKRVPTPLFHAKAKSYIKSDPYGVTLIIAPWNYPFQLSVGPLIGAMAAGNTAVIKPSEISPNTSAVIAQMFNEHFDPKYIAVVEGGIPESKALLDEKFDYIFYTGSTVVGKLVYQSAAKHLTPVTLELGGKSPCIVDNKTHLEYTAKRIVWGKLVNAGQTCIAPDYLLVHNDIKDKLIEEMRKQIKAMYSEDPSKSDEYGRIISEKHFKRISALMDKDKIVVGGKVDAYDRYIEPTIMEGVNDDDPVMQEEIFGPVLPVMTYENIEEVITYINKHPKPLALYVFSKNQGTIDKVIGETSSGGVCVNDTLMHIGTPHLPFGGVGDSGIGAYHGQSSFDTFSHKKSIMHKSFLLDMPIRYTPYTAKASKMLRTLLKYTNR
ncbi:MAG: aldehyde dehydrogenase [Bacteroidota bacterium]